MSKVVGIGARGHVATGEVVLNTTGGAVVAPAASDGNLVELCLNGDGAAFGRLVRLHESMVYGLAARLLGDREEARDLAQDVFLQVYRTLAQFRGASSLRTWIYRITLNQCRNRHRFWRRRRRAQACPLDALTVAEEGRMAEAGSLPATPFEKALQRERSRAVQAALLRVSFDHRAILVLREVEGLSCDQIGVTLGIPEGTVKSRLARAREALRRELLPQLEARA